MVSELSALDELRKMQSSKPRGAKCTAGLLLRTLPEDERGAFVEALKDELIDANTISIWLDRKGHKVGRHTVARHRRGECQCR
ncbi:hypothetical protein UFOVP529_7 [uncultured Caudovirales phage]|uniref:Uncharacterized protein n=1 Tax=uncultured Caudovirales phage TaxID=2100421 RepID=A0A6J5MTU2_9CAUD|nr:hypothetical protein UFOVP529_7 [uncultured Caudovirales phage]CAB4190500.1 hypothetical protein UFOVP1191_65 [uncultured Caudovirales phage]CAB4194538.1 hypothetical protein UFOVP1252_113 [uncultured Caudovirales phage]